MRRLALATLLLVSLAPYRVDAAPYARVGVEPIPNADILPACDAADENSWLLDLANGTLRCEGGQWVSRSFGQQGPQGEVGPQGPPGESFIPGFATFWTGPRVSIPAGWQECDGTNSTPDARGWFPRAAAAAGEAAGITGGSNTHDHTYGDVIAHTHGLQRYPTTSGGSSGFTADTSMGGTQTAVTQTTQAPVDSVATGTTTAVSHVPGYMTFIVICKVW